MSSESLPFTVSLDLAPGGAGFSAALDEAQTALAWLREQRRAQTLALLGIPSRRDDLAAAQAVADSFCKDTSDVAGLRIRGFAPRRAPRRAAGAGGGVRGERRPGPGPGRARPGPFGCRGGGGSRGRRGGAVSRAPPRWTPARAGAVGLRRPACDGWRLVAAIVGGESR